MLACGGGFYPQQVIHEGRAPAPEVIREIVGGYLFALSTAPLGGDFEIAPFPGPFEEFDAYDDEEDGVEEIPMPPFPSPEWNTWEERRRREWDERGARFLAPRRTPHLRPVVLGRGMADLNGMFLRALSPDHDLEYRILCFAKVVEYVSLTAVKQKAHGEIRRRLMDGQVLAPDARFIEDLIQLVEAQREYRKDAEALRIAIREFADLAASLSATRNQIAHGKANYGATGRECPPDQMGAFVELLRKLSVQGIHWFAALPDSMRVVR